MSDLAGFLMARIAEDEGVARAAVRMDPTPWRVDSHGDEAFLRVTSPHGPTSIFEGDPYAATADTVTVTHIARHDPARVLAECAAKRAIVGQWEMTQPPVGQAVHLAADELELTLCILATVYADHPDFDARWTQ